MAPPQARYLPPSRSQPPAGSCTWGGSSRYSSIIQGSAELGSVRGSPQTVETSVLVIMVRAGCPCCARVWPGQARTCPLFLLPGVPGGQGGPQGRRPQGRRPQGDAQHPGGRGGGPVRLAGAARTAAAQPPPFPGPRSGPAAVTRRPFPPATARNRLGTSCPAPPCQRRVNTESARYSRLAAMTENSSAGRLRTVDAKASCQSSPMSGGLAASSTETQPASEPT
jgi:hypothetical protein